MSCNWGDYESRQVGDWRLDSLLGVRGSKAFYLTSNPKGGGALLLEMAAAGDEGSRLLASWNRARKLADTHLLKVYGTGEADLDGNRVVFGVMDLPDDDLGEMLTRGRLEQQQARMLFASVAGTLESLHRRGLSHGDVTPPNIFVLGSEIRLGVDTIAPGGERGRQEDLRQFGATLIQALIGQKDADAANEPELLHQVAQLEAPFYDVAVGALSGSREKQWSAAQIVEALTAEKRGSVESRPDPRPLSAPPPQDRKLAARQSFASWLGGPQWPIMATAGVVAIVLGIYLLVHGPRPHTAPPAAVSERPIEARVQPGVAEPAPERPPVNGAAERTTPTPPSPPPPAAPSTRTGHWAVIAATYATFEGAEKLVHKIEERAPSLHPHVFPPAGQGKHYFVVLGSGLTQREAERLRRDATSQGAPHDSYVTKLDES